MSDYKVPLTKILEINPHPNADRLSLATVYGFQVVIQKDKYKVGDVVLYVPIDSLLPSWLEERIFPKDSKIKLHNARVRQIRIRKIASQGMLIDTTQIADKINFKRSKLEQDLSVELQIVKYEPPVPGPSLTIGRDKQRNRTYEHPLFHKYNGLDSIKWFPTLFNEEDHVTVQEKLHGTNARASILPYRANTLFKKLVKLIGLAPKVEHCYGSNNVQKSVGGNKKHFYEGDVWGDTFKALDVFEKIKFGETIFGEIVGPGIQQNYDYDLKEHTFVLFDVKVLKEDGKQSWLSPAEVKAFAIERGFNMVPELYSGPYNKDLLYTMTQGPSVFDPKTKVREGIVIKSTNDYDVNGNKKALKWVSEAYLDDISNTDFH